MIVGKPTTYQDEEGSITCWNSDFVVGIDNKLVELKKQFSDLSHGKYNVDDCVVDINRLIQSGHFGRIHVLDVQSEDPEGFYFSHYGLETNLENGKSFKNRSIAEAQWNALSEFACSDFARIKNCSNRYDMVQVEVQFERELVEYRRLALPLSFKRDGSVAQILVCVLPLLSTDPEN